MPTKQFLMGNEVLAKAARAAGARGARAIELAITNIAADPKRLEKVGRSKEKTRIARLVRFFLRYGDSPIRKYDDDWPRSLLDDLDTQADAHENRSPVD